MRTERLTDLANFFCNFVNTLKEDKVRKELVTADIFGRRLSTVGYWALSFVQKLV